MLHWWRNKGHLPEQHVLPTDGFKASKVFGKRKARRRFLSDAEIVAFWRETEKLPPAYQALFRVLLLTGARLNEVAQAKWRSIVGNSIRVEADDFKSDHVHHVPLSAMAMKIIETIPHKDGFIFSSSFGKFALSKIAERKAELNLGTTEPWIWHDLRRTMTRGLRKAGVEKPRREMALGHSLRGLDANYEAGDEEDFQEETLATAELWAARVDRLINPPQDPVKGDNVVSLIDAA